MSLLLISESYFLESDDEAGDEREEKATKVTQAIEITEGNKEDAERKSIIEEPDTDDGGEPEPQPLEYTLQPENEVDNQTNVGSEKTQISDDTQIDIQDEGNIKAWKCLECAAHFETSRGLRTHEFRVHQRTVKKKKNIIWDYRQIRRRGPRSNPGKAPNLTKRNDQTLKNEKVLNDKHEVEGSVSGSEVNLETVQPSFFVRKEEPLKCPYCLGIHHGTEQLIQHFATCNGYSERGRERAEVAGTQQLPNDRHGEKISSQKSSNFTHNFQCSKCHAPFTTLRILTKHMKVHESTGRPWKCSTCGCAFMRLSNLRAHENRLHGGRTKVLISGTEMDGTSKNKKSDRFKCSICNLVTNDGSSLRKHQRRIHVEKNPDGTNKLWKCSGCRSFFKKSSHLRIHENRVHNRTIGGVKVPCKVCGKLFKASKMNSHMYAHSITRQFKCPLCPRTFKRKSNTTRHLRTVHGKRAHMALKLFQSSNVKATSSLTSLKNVQSTKGNAGNTKSACKICLKVFSSSKLAIHLRRHSEEKRRFKCLICKNQYQYKSYAIRHLRNVHGKLEPTEILKFLESFDKSKKGTSPKAEDIARKIRPCTVHLIRCDNLIPTYVTPPADTMVGNNENLGDCEKSSNSRAKSVGTNVEAENNSGIKQKQSSSFIGEIPKCRYGWVFRNLKKRPTIIPPVRTTAEMDPDPKNNLAVVTPPALNQAEATLFSEAQSMGRNAEAENNPTRKRKRGSPSIKIPNCGYGWEFRNLNKRRKIIPPVKTIVEMNPDPENNPAVMEEPPSQNTRVDEHRKDNMDTTTQTQHQELPNKDVRTSNQDQAETARFSETMNKTGAENDQEDKIFRCPFCLVPFVGSASLIAHLPTHSVDFDKRRDSVLANDQTHSKKVVNVEGFPTTHQSSASIDEPSLSNPAQPHIKERSEEGRAFKCSKCNYSSTTFKNLRIHEGRAHKASKFLHLHKCQHCDYSSKDPGHVTQHMELHKEEGRPFKCVRCSCRFTTSQTLRTHESRFHKTSESVQATAAPTVHKCQSCKFSTVILRDWENHVTSHKKVIPIRKPFKCSLCSVCFHNLKELRIHAQSVHYHGRYQGQNGKYVPPPIRFHYLPIALAKL